jgi:U6 snRNA-associated Sm-like protein LSm3
VLGDVEETIYTAEEDEDDEDKEPVVKTVKKQSEMLFVRGQPSHLNLFREIKC